MTTEYRRNIPSVAHVEAATRLGLLWLGSDMWLHRFRNRNGQIEVWYFEDPNATPDWEAPDFAIEDLDFRPIRPDGTPVDWEVLDQEVARVGQQGQPQGFRADLWRRICRHFISAETDTYNQVTFDDIVSLNDTACHFTQFFWDWRDVSGASAAQTDILARWTVYRELKPLYDLVDGVQGEAAMPRDVEAEWSVCSGGSDTASGNWRLCRNGEGLYAQGVCAGLGGETAYVRWHPSEGDYGVPLRNFAAVLDAVAERRVAERMREQTQAPTVTSAQPEPRRFADVRPDRHGWRWWRVQGPDIANTAQIECSNHLGEVERQFRFRGSGFEPWTTFILDRWLDRTVIPTDEQGNPVSWLSCGLLSHISVGSVGPMLPMQASFEGPTGEIEFSDAYTPPPGASGWMTLSGLHDSMRALPRFGLIELDDVDHSKTTKLDEVTLRRGELPTVEQIAKYREVRARRTGGAVADALKESRIDCEVAQYVLERWAGGLGDEEAHDLIHSTATLRVVVKGVVHIKAVDSRVVSVLSDCYSLDTSEKPSPTVQRERQEAEERRQRLAELRQRLATERAAQPQEMARESEMSRFDLIEPDPQADPAASIRAWEERQEAAKAAAKLRPSLVTEREREPPRGPTVELVDATRLGFWLGRMYALANTDLPDTRLGARLGPRQRASG